jgi:hypothetical protein
LTLATRPASVSGPCAPLPAPAKLTRRFSRACTGFRGEGAEAFYFQQITGDSGPGAVLGDFKGRTAGLGPVAGYIHPLSKTESLVFELKWLPELDTKNRLDGDYIWLKMVYKF